MPHNSTRDRALKDVSTFTVSKLSYLFLLLSSLVGRSAGAFHVVLLLVAYGIFKPERLEMNILHKKGKKKVSSTCNTDNRFYCIYVEKEIVLGGCFANCDYRMDFSFFKPGWM